MWKKWKVSIIVALITSFVFAAPALAKFSDQTLLSSMASLNIFELTRDLVGETDGMLKETEQLKEEVSIASDTLDALEKQDELLASQIETNKEIQAQLEAQLAGNMKARGLMEQILAREEKTYQLTRQVVTQADNITGQMNQTVEQLSKVAVTTGHVGKNTEKMNGQMDQLLAQLDQSVANFRFFARLNDAFSYLQNKLLKQNLPKPSGVSQENNQQPLPASVKDPLNQLLNPTQPNQDKSKDESRSGLLDLLLP